MNEINLQQIFEQILARVGLETGKKITAEINRVINATDVDIQQIRNMLETIQHILDAKPDTEEFDVAENIIRAINDIRTQVENNRKAIADLQKQINDIQSSNQQTQSSNEDLQSQVDELKRTKADKSYVDSAFVQKSDITNINIDNIVNIYVRCLNEGVSNKDATVDDCQGTSTSTTSGSSSAQATSENSDGGVL